MKGHYMKKIICLNCESIIALKIEKGSDVRDFFREIKSSDKKFICPQCGIIIDFNSYLEFISDKTLDIIKYFQNWCEIEYGRMINRPEYGVFGVHEFALDNNEVQNG